jgi:hypothetical protein
VLCVDLRPNQRIVLIDQAFRHVKRLQATDGPKCSQPSSRKDHSVKMRVSRRACNLDPAMLGRLSVEAGSHGQPFDMPQQSCGQPAPGRCQRRGRPAGAKKQ